MKTCKVEGCGNIIHAKEYCQKHYWRNKRYGDPGIIKIEKHGLIDSPEYQVWQNMKNRCTNPNYKGYHNYGGRGIIVCDRWKHSFSNFYHDLGKRPFSKAQIDRIDNNGNYEPSNCRWVTNAENSHNTRKNVLNWFTVKSIRRLYAMKKYTREELSLIYSLNKETIKNVVLEKTWREV